MAIATEKSLPTEAVQAIQDYVVDNFQQKLVGRQVLFRTDVGAEKTTYKYYRIDSEMINAQVIAPKGSFPREDLRKLEELVDTIKKIGLGFDISREDYMQQNWVNRSVREITYKVAKKEDDTIINGDADYNIKGIADVYGNETTSTGGVWSDASSSGAMPTNDLITAIGDLQQNSGFRFGNDPKDLVLLLNPQNKTELMQKFHDEDKQRALPFFTDLLGAVITSPSVVEGTGYLMETGLDIARLVLAEDITVESPVYNIDNQSWQGNIFTRSLPVFLQYGSVAGKTTAIQKIGTI